MTAQGNLGSEQRFDGPVSPDRVSAAKDKRRQAGVGARAGRNLRLWCGRPGCDDLGRAAPAPRAHEFCR
jgi:hypothetical protein